MLTGSLIFTLFLSTDYSGCAFWTMVAYGTAFVLAFFLDEVKMKNVEDKKTTGSTLPRIMSITVKDVRFLGFLLASALIMNASWLVSVMLNQDKYLSLGLTEQQMGVIAIVIAVAGLFSAGSSFVTKKIGFRKFLSAATLVMSIAAILMGVTRLVIIAFLCHFLVDFGSNLLSPLINELQNERVSVEERATQLSVYGMIIDLMSIGLSVITSMVAKLSVTAIFMLAAIEFLFAILFVYLCYGSSGKQIGEKKETGEING